MAEKRKGRKRKEEFPEPGSEKEPKPSKDEFKIANWIRANVPVKKTKFLGHNVQYFTGTKAVDALMSSKWSVAEKENEKAFFTSREHCVDYLNLMLINKFYHRARKVLVSEDELKKKKKEDKKKEKEIDKDNKKEKSKEDKDDDNTEVKTEGEGDNNEDGKKKKKKIRLEMHEEQRFVDSLDAYVWLYEPIPVYYWLIGTLVVFAAIGICMFPLWPVCVRQIVYYISIAAAGFLVLILTLTVLKMIIFCLIWVLTLGRHHFWILPNLTEDVGFFASFWPLYKYEYRGPDVAAKKKKKKKEKCSDNEDDDEKCLLEKDETINQQTIFESCSIKDEDEGASGSESSTNQSSTGKDFEMVDKDDLISDMK